MRRTRPGNKYLLQPVLLFFAVTITLLSCSDRPPTGPTQPTEDIAPAIIDPADGERPANVSQPSKFKTETGYDIDPASDKEFIGADSGLVQPGLDGRIPLKHLQGDNEFAVNAGAIDQTAQIVVGTWRVPSRSVAVYEFHFGPEDLRFNSAASLVLEQALFTRPHLPPPVSITWWYLNPGTSQWCEPIVVPLGNDGRFHIPVSHFSVYQAVGDGDFGLSQGGQ